jgi:hypothetical protein
VHLLGIPPSCCVHEKKCQVTQIAVPGARILVLAGETEYLQVIGGTVRIGVYPIVQQVAVVIPV